MSATAETVSTGVDALQVIIFKVADIVIAVDSDQVAEMVNIEAMDGNSDNIDWIDEMLSFGKGKIAYKAPTVLILKEEGERRGVVIDNPQEFVMLPVESIKPFPRLLEFNSLNNAFWGAFTRDDDTVLLLDLYRIMGK